MSLVSLAGKPVAQLRLTQPVRGVWTADMMVESDTAFVGRADLVLAETRFTGCIRQAGMSRGYMVARLVGGNGGLGSVDVAAQGYYRVPLRIPVQDILAAANETLSTTSDAGVLALELQSWTRLSHRASMALRQLLEGRAQWRFLMDGSLWVGQDTWPEAGFDLETIEDRPDIGKQVVELDPRILPGTSFDGRKASSVEHIVTESELQTVIMWERE